MALIQPWKGGWSKSGMQYAMMRIPASVCKITPPLPWRNPLGFSGSLSFARLLHPGGFALPKNTGPMRKGREIERHCRLSPQHSTAVWRTCRSSHSRQNEPVLKGFFWQGSAKGLICLAASNFTSRDRQTDRPLFSSAAPTLSPILRLVHRSQRVRSSLCTK